MQRNINNQEKLMYLYTLSLLPLMTILHIVEIFFNFIGFLFIKIGNLLQIIRPWQLTGEVALILGNKIFKESKPH